MDQTKKLDNLDILLINPPFHRILNERNTHFPLGLGYINTILNKNGVSSLIYNADYIEHPNKITKKDNFKKNNEDFKTFIRKVFGKKFFTAYLKTTNMLIHYFNILVAFYKKTFTGGYNSRKNFLSNINDDKQKIWKEIEFTINKYKPKVIGISAKMVDLPATFKIAKIAKKILPEVKIVVGGAAASTASDLIIKDSVIDALILGEGEETFLELASYYLKNNNNSDLKEIKGIVHKEKGKINKTPPRELILDLDSIPFPDRNDMFYIGNNYKVNFVSIANDVLTSRGCPYLCKFCACHSTWFTKKARIRSNENIIKELKFLYETHGQKEFIFWDDLFTINREKTIDLCNQIKDNDLDIKWTCLARLNTIDKDLLDIMKDAGCIELAVGIESGNNRVLNYIGKKLTVEKIIEKAKVIEESGLRWLAFYIIGFPSETEDEIKDTISLIKKLKPTHSRIGPFTPFPGSKFYEQIKEDKNLKYYLNKKDLYYMYYNFTGTMNDEKFESLLNEALVLNT